MKVTKTTIVGIAVLGLMLCSFLSPASAAATWPVAAGDVLEYTEKEDYSYEGPDGSRKENSVVTFSIEIVKVDANGTIVWKFVGDKAKEQVDDIWYIEPMNAMLVMDSEYWKAYSKNLENMSTSAYIEEYKKNMKTLYEDIYKYTSFTIEVEITSDASSMEYKETITFVNKDNEKVERTSEGSESWENGVLVEMEMSQKQTIADAAGERTSEWTVSAKQGGAGIPGYSVPVFLGILAFTTLGLVVVIRRRK